MAAKNAGCDFVFIDTEHIPIDREKLSWMCRAYAAMGMPPIVRVPGKIFAALYVLMKYRARTVPGLHAP